MYEVIDSGVLANSGAKRTAVLHDEQRFFHPLVMIAL
jgi:hypothetical protein